MPYGGTTPEQDEAIDKCISDLGDEYTEEEKIKICKARVLGEDEEAKPKQDDEDEDEDEGEEKKPTGDKPDGTGPYGRGNGPGKGKGDGSGMEDEDEEDEDEDEEKDKKKSMSGEVITLSIGVANVELIEDNPEKNYSMFKFELIDNNEYNGVHFTTDSVKHQYEEFHSHDYVIPHGLDHSQKTLDQLGQVVNMEIDEQNDKIKAYIVSKIFKETETQKQAQILFKQGNLNYISGGWSGRLSYNEELDRFEFNDPILREVSSTPTPAKRDARLIDVLNSLKPHNNPDKLEELVMNEKPAERPSNEGVEEQSDRFTALKEEVNMTRSELAEMRAKQDEQVIATLLKRGSELGLSADLFAGKTPAEIEFAMEVANEAVVVALRENKPTTELGGQGSGAPEDGTPEALAELKAQGYYSTLIGE